MTLEQLRIFVAVAEREHMTRASEILRLTQSGVSAAIAALEARYATQLFHRVRRHVELTTAGKLFLIEAKSVLARAAAAEKVLTEIGGLKRGVLSIHASQTISGYWLPKHLTAFHKAYPDIEVRLGIGNTAQVASAIRSGTAELGFVEGVVDDPLLATDVVAGDQLAVVVGPSHPWAGRKDFEPFELAQTDWVLREQGSGTRSEFAAALRGFGLNLQFLRIALELPSNEAVCGAVEAGAGATAISELLVGLSIRAGTLCRIPLAMPARSFSILTHRERQRSKVVEAFQEFFRAALPTKEAAKPLARVAAAVGAAQGRSRR
jgi:DNA-binding transcriptional LysR family regulator